MLTVFPPPIVAHLKASIDVLVNLLLANQLLPSQQFHTYDAALVQFLAAVLAHHAAAGRRSLWRSRGSVEGSLPLKSCNSTHPPQTIVTEPLSPVQSLQAFLRLHMCMSCIGLHKTCFGQMYIWPCSIGNPCPRDGYMSKKQVHGEHRHATPGWEGTGLA